MVKKIRRWEKMDRKVRGFQVERKLKFLGGRFGKGKDGGQRKEITLQKKKKKELIYIKGDHQTGAPEPERVKKPKQRFFGLSREGDHLDMGGERAGGQAKLQDERAYLGRKQTTTRRRLRSGGKRNRFSSPSKRGGTVKKRANFER